MYTQSAHPMKEVQNLIEGHSRGILQLLRNGGSMSYDCTNV
jgi:hypothetical protein